MVDIEIVWSGESHAFQLADGQHTVGRASENAVQIPVARVSKTHATLRVDGTRLFVRDHGSSNGTEVNGRPVTDVEVEVPAGTLVSFAGALLRRKGMETSASHRLLDDRSVSMHMSYASGQGYSSAARDRIVDNSSALFELLASGDTPAEVGEAACQFVSLCVTADRVVLLEDDGEGTAIDARSRWMRAGDDDAPLQLSSTIVNTVFNERVSVLVADAAEDPRFGGQKSVMALKLRSAMAAPLFDNERVRGILYVDTSSSKVRYGREDLEVLSAAANAVAVKLRNISYEKEMNTAAQIQRSMLPQHLTAPAGYSLEAYQLMCRTVGGDLYHFVERPGGSVLMALGDVSGKGTPAALAMGAAIVLIGMLAEIEGSMGKLAGHLHRQLFRSLGPEQFITLFMADLDPATGKMTYVNAGHEPPLIIHEDGTVDTLEPTGLPIAMIEDIMLTENTAHILPGDLVVVFSDGIPEATTNGETFLELGPVRDDIVANRSLPLPEIRKRIVAQVRAFLGGQRASDDVTLMLLRREGSNG